MSKTIHIKTLLTIMTLALLGTVLAVAEASHNWSKYHWDKSTEDSITNPLILGDNLTTAAWESSLTIASAEWNKSVLHNQVAPNGTNTSCIPVLGQVEICNAEYGTNGWLGIAQVWVYRGRDGHIAQSLVKVNDTYYNSGKYNTSAWRDFVMCQEVGHAFGLGHQDESFSNANLGTCMDYTNDPDGTIFEQLDNRYPNEHDFDMLTEIYGHLNGVVDDGGGGSGKPDKCNPWPSCKNGNAIGADTALNERAEWGQAVRQDARGNDSLFVRNLGNGMELITHVIWVE